MASHKTLYCSVIGAAALAAAVIAISPRDDRVRKADADAIRTRDTAAAAPITVEAFGTVSLDPDGILIVTSNQSLHRNGMGFALDWDEATKTEAAAGAIDLFEIDGWVGLRYSPDTQRLHLRAVDAENGKVVDDDFALNPTGQRDLNDLLEYTRSVFAFVSGATDEEGATATATTVPSTMARCTCTGSDSYCSATCDAASFAYCRHDGETGCSCGCSETGAE